MHGTRISFAVILICAAIGMSVAARADGVPIRIG